MGFKMDNRKITVRLLDQEEIVNTFRLSDYPYNPQDQRYFRRSDFKYFITDIVLELDDFFIVGILGSDDIRVDTTNKENFNKIISFLEKYGEHLDEKKTINP